MSVHEDIIKDYDKTKKRFKKYVNHDDVKKQEGQRYEYYLKKFETLYFKDCPKCRKLESSRLINDDKKEFMCLTCYETFSDSHKNENENEQERQKILKEKESHTKLTPIRSEERSAKLLKKARTSNEEKQEINTIRRQQRKKRSVYDLSDEGKKQYFQKYKYQKERNETIYDPSKNNTDTVFDDMTKNIDDLRKKVFENSF